MRCANDKMSTMGMGDRNEVNGMFHWVPDSSLHMYLQRERVNNGMFHWVPDSSLRMYLQRERVNNGMFHWVPDSSLRMYLQRERVNNGMFHWVPDSSLHMYLQRERVNNGMFHWVPDSSLRMYLQRERVNNGMFHWVPDSFLHIYLQRERVNNGMFHWVPDSSLRMYLHHTSWVTVVTPTDRLKSVRNRCVIELFCGVVCVVTLPFWHFCWCMGFCHRTESDLFLFLYNDNGGILQCFSGLTITPSAYKMTNITVLNRIPDNSLLPIFTW